LHTGFWWEDLIERHHLEELCADEDDIKTHLQEVGCEVWTGLIWLRTGTHGGHL
jgi:hypothetical protein